MSGILDLGTNVSTDENPSGTVASNDAASRDVASRDDVAVVPAVRIRPGRPYQDGPQRTGMHTVIVPTLGSGMHLVDFEPVPVSVGSVVHVQPGQVQQFDPESMFDALLVIVRPDACPPGLFRPSEPNPSIDLGGAGPSVISMARSLALEQERSDCSDGVMVAGAAFILHHLGRAGGHADRGELSPHAQLLRMFRAEVEERFSESRNVSVYARSIGTSTKTLARATTNLTGLAPKEIIDQRVVLEAKRLLGHGSDSIAGIGEALGFSEATNFTKFFARMTGQTPHEFRS